MKTIPVKMKPEAFGLNSFADILPTRDPIIGEDPGSFAAFHQSMIVSFGPVTPYEWVLTESLIDIEWELLQHRRMRDACIRQKMHDDICVAVLKQLKAEHEAALEEAWGKHKAAGGTKADWKEPFKFDPEEAVSVGSDLADRAISRDVKRQASAYKKIEALGLKPVELMSQAYTSDSSNRYRHEQKLPDLERRRRDVKNALDALQKTRPIEAKVIESEEVDA